MSSLSINLRYRPLRIGWCVARDDIEGLRAAMRQSFTLWGGRFNPIIPIDDAGDQEAASRLVRLFRADALHPISDAPAVTAFVGAQPHLRCSAVDRGLVLDRGHGQRSSAIADLLHPIERIHREVYRNNPAADPLVTLYEWELDDPLADVMLATFGGLPPVAECAEDYLGLLRMHLKAQRALIAPDQPIPQPPPDRFTLAALNMAFVEQHYAVRNPCASLGIYVGDARSFDDLVQYWNLRATAIRLQFHDPAQASRLDAWRDAWSAMLPPAQELGWPGGAAVWSRRGCLFDARALGRPFIRHHVDEEMWNGMNVKAPTMHFGGASVLASIDRLDAVPKLTFALSERPRTESGSPSGQRYIVSVEPGIGLYKDDLNTLHLPFIPELNEFYGRNAHFRHDAARAEPGSLGVVVSGSTDHLSVHAVDATRLIAEVFKTAGMAASQSPAGLVCSRLIRQMGGLDGCRVFRIGGVRKLIENHAPDQSFTRSTAKRTILADGTDHPLADYQSLYIEQRDPRSKLTNDAVLAHLLNKDVFRPGLKLSCPSCRLQFWRSIDDVRTRSECEYCGHVFNLGPQLRDRDWAFRRSGLFGRNDNQEGALPVILTLQQLANALDMSGSTFATALELTPDGADVAKCETDFVLMPRRETDGRVEIVIGECKTRQPITAQDVDNLRRVAEAFPADRFSVFVVFSKLSGFHDDEIALIRALNQDHRHRAIVLTTRELEPWHVYERTEKEFGIEMHGASLSDMAAVTEAVFFDRRSSSGDDSG